MADPVLLRINKRWTMILCGCAVLLGFYLLALVALPLWFGIFHWLVFAGLALGLYMMWLALFYAGITRQDPVALRMDESGISGFFVPATNWREIKRITHYKDQKHNVYLGFEMNDPAALHARQTAWQRFKTWQLRRQNVQISVPLSLLQVTSPDDLIARADALKSAAKLNDPRPHIKVT